MLKNLSENPNDLIMSNESGMENEPSSRLGMLGGGPGVDGLHGEEHDKGSRLEMLDEASLTRQPEEVPQHYLCVCSHC